MESLKSEINLLINASMAQNTWKTYKTAVESFNAFRSLYKMSDIWPAPLNDIIYYIAYLSYTGLSASTVVTYISGLSHTHNLHGWEDNTKSFLVGKILEGLRRKKPKIADLRVPISLSLLKKMIQSFPSVCTSNYESVMFASAYSLCFFALLRIGEIVADRKLQSCNHVIQVSDISFHKTDTEEELYVKIRSSKTDQHSLSTTLIVCRQKDELICPVRLLKKYLEFRHPSFVSNLYIHYDGTNLTRYQFSSVLQRVLSFCDVSGHFRSHSFRIGGASEAKRLGIDDETIKKWGRWVSDVYLNYIRLNL